MEVNDGELAYLRARVKELEKVVKEKEQQVKSLVSSSEELEKANKKS